MQVNYRCKLTHPVARVETLERVAAAIDGSGITRSVSDGEVGALGIPRWTTVWFHAQHSDYERLRTDTLARLDQAGLSGEVVELNP